MSRPDILAKNGIGSMLAACLGPPRHLAASDTAAREALQQEIRTLQARVRQLESELVVALSAALASSRQRASEERAKFNTLGSGESGVTHRPSVHG
jgi:uncharacterized protein YlxW (UPF0749 family)